MKTLNLSILLFFCSALFAQETDSIIKKIDDYQFVEKKLGEIIYLDENKDTSTYKNILFI